MCIEIKKVDSLFQYLSEKSSTGHTDTEQIVNETAKELYTKASTHDSIYEAVPSTPGIYSSTNLSYNDSNKHNGML